MCNSINQNVPDPDNERRKCRQIVKLQSGAPSHPKAKMCLQNIYGIREVRISWKLISGGILDCVKHLIQNRIKQCHVFCE